MSMSSPVEATLALDGLAIGAQVVACGIDDDGTAFGLLYEHRQLSNGTRYWKQVTGNGVALIDRLVARNPNPMNGDGSNYSLGLAASSIRRRFDIGPVAPESSSRGSSE